MQYKITHYILKDFNSIYKANLCIFIQAIMVSRIKCALHDYSLFHKFRQNAVIFLPARSGSQTHASHKGRMILNHESPAGCIKIVAKSLHSVFATFVLSVFF